MRLLIFCKAPRRGNSLHFTLVKTFRRWGRRVEHATNPLFYLFSEGRILLSLPERWYGGEGIIRRSGNSIQLSTYILVLLFSLLLLQSRVGKDGKQRAEQEMEERRNGFQGRGGGKGMLSLGL